MTSRFFAFPPLAPAFAARSIAIWASSPRSRDTPVIPGRAQREPGIRRLACVLNKLEIPGLALWAIPDDDE